MWATLAFATSLTLAPHHSGTKGPASAFPYTPLGIDNIVDKQFEVTWTDWDMPISTGTATVDLYFTDYIPEPVPFGETPLGLIGEPIVQGILEKDHTNAYLWDTSSVAAGNYWIWTRINEPPEDPPVPPAVVFSAGLVTVVHPGDEIPPVVMFTKPDDAFAWSNEAYEVRWRARDPDDSASIKLEAFPKGKPEEAYLVAEGLTPDEKGRYSWDTLNLAEGDWVLKATIEDDRGQSFSSHARFTVLVTHLAPDAGIATSSDAGTSDSGPAPDPKDGCSHSDTGHTSGVEFLLVLLFGLMCRKKC